MDQVPPVVQDLDILGLLTRPGTYVLALGIFIVTFFIRRFIESIWPRLKKQHDENSPKITYLSNTARWWNDVILPVTPVALGAISAIWQSTFFFDGIGDKGGRYAFGGAVGWFAATLYKGLRRAVKQKLGLELTPEPGDSDVPPAL